MDVDECSSFFFGATLIIISKQPTDMLKSRLILFLAGTLLAALASAEEQAIAAHFVPPAVALQHTYTEWFHPEDRWDTRCDSSLKYLQEQPNLPVNTESFYISFEFRCQESHPWGGYLRILFLGSPS